MARYRMLKSLGTGAAGAVWLVEDSAAGGAQRALKRLEAGSDPDFRASFAREFGMLASLSVKGVAPVFDLGTLPAEGELPAGPYFTRAFIPGDALDTFALAQPLSERMRVFVALAAIVRALHQRGVIHGDIKPANAIVDPDGQPWLIDFGLSAHVRETDALRGSGTLPYMAPELLAGGAPSAASDVYALASSLWQLITGAAPPRVQRDIPRRDAQGRELTAAELDALEIARAGMAADPRERVASADELGARVQAAFGVAATVAPPVHTLTPRTRGRSALLAELEHTLRAEGRAAFSLVVGEAGAGKSTLLRELKWRLQLAGEDVWLVEGRALGHAPAAQLRALGAADDTLRAHGRRAVLLVDDLDALEPAWIERMRVADDVGGPGRAPHILASAREGLAHVPVHTLPTLSREDAAALVRDLFGALDPGVEARLLARTAGVPGTLVEAAGALAGRVGVTPADIDALALGELTRLAAERRVASLSDDARTLAYGLAVASGPLTHEFVAAWLGQAAEGARRALEVLRIAEGDAQNLRPADPTLCAALRAYAGDALARVAERMNRVPERAALTLPVRARSALSARAADELALCLAGRVAELVAALPPADARALLEGALTLLTGEARRDVELALGELYVNTGEGARALALAEELLGERTLSTHAASRARIIAARAHIASGALGPAEAHLDAVDARAPDALRACAACELARIALRRGAFEAAGDAAREGLERAAPRDAVRAELGAVLATAHARLGRSEDARRAFEVAIAFADAHAPHRERALAHGYHALELERSGELERAGAAYERASQEARDAGDVGQLATYASNLGNVRYRLGEVERSEDSFVLAARLAERAGRHGMARVAEVNLAHVLVYVGAYARARAVTEACLARAQDAPLVLAEATRVLADIDACTGRSEQALSGYAHSHAQYHALGRHREACEALLGAAECRLDRGGVSDASAASSELGEARRLLDVHALHDFRPLHELLVARVRMHNGDVEGAVRELQGLETRVRAASDRELRWKVAHALSLGYAASRATPLAASAANEAAELIEALAVRLSPDLRDGFRRDPRRKAALAQHEALRLASQAEQARPDTRLVHGTDARYRRLLDVNKRLARERNVDRVLERITDTAIELSGAERGFVLLVDARGALGAHVVRVHGGEEGDPHVAFSRSIAEAVLIDGEPIVTVNARDDRRLSEYLSVHKLMLKSVACIPINGKDRTLGVLYLEHRMRVGRFDEHDLDLLLAFADQAAIALENARLWSEVESQRAELKASNDALASAKGELERVLHARTEELHEVRAHLEKARLDSASLGRRYGIVGRSAAMQRLFALLERVQQSHVPVVVQGESGTGKELVARAIHHGGVRVRGPFVTVNCAALPENLIESELFGHVRGAFTGADRDRKGVFAQAHGGTLFLDEFTEASPRVQVALLRVLQEGRVLPVGADGEIPIDVRVVVASQRPLAELVAHGKLREDLFYRLSVVELRVPPLRERREDIAELCEHLLLQIARREHREAPRLTRGALDALFAHPLPGNVRQLEHLLLSATMMSDGAALEAEHLGVFGDDDEGVRRGSEAPSASESVPPLSLPSDLGAYKAREKARILDALDRHAWNRAKAASELGMPRRTFYRRLSEFGILEEGSESA